MGRSLNLSTLHIAVHDGPPFSYESLSQFNISWVPQSAEPLAHKISFL